MIRFLLRSVFRFCAALLLLALLVCAAEVAFRGVEMWLKTHNRVSLVHESLTVPSAASWIDVEPLAVHMQPRLPGPPLCIRTNELGLRGGCVTIPKPRGTFRILCLGGDNVFGSELDAGGTLPVLLQSALQSQTPLQVEVLNAGCPQAGPLINLLRYRSHLSSLQPDLVLLCLTTEDAAGEDDVRGALQLDQNHNPAFAPHPALTAPGCEVLDGLCQEFRIVRWAMNWAGKSAGLKRGMQSLSSRDRSTRNLAAIAPLQELVSGNLSKLIISLSPSGWGTQPDSGSQNSGGPPLVDDTQRFLAAARLTDRIPVQNALTGFCQVPDKRPFLLPATGTLTASGNEVYARQLAEFVLHTVPEMRGHGLPAGTPAVPVTTAPPPIPLAPDRPQLPSAGSPSPPPL